MDMQLQGQHALVTGSTAGIGFAIAKALAAEGATVTINGRSDASVGKALQRLQTLLPEASLRGVTADAATAKGCEQLTAGSPPIDILVNNMGIFPTVLLLFILLGDILSTLPLVLRVGTLTGLVVLIMTWVVAPQLTRVMKPWLHAGRKH